MSAAKKISIIRQTRKAYPSTTNTYKNDDMVYDYEDDMSPTQQSVQYASNTDLIRTRDLDQQKSSSAKTTSSWYTSTRGLIIAGIVLLVLVVLVVVPTVLAVTLTRNPTVINNTTTTTIAPTATTAYWGFDNNANDSNGIYNGAPVSGATYSNSTYFGYGYNLQLNASINQSIVVSSPFFNLSYTSFTVEAWIYVITPTGDNAIFSQCQCTSCQDQCLYLMIRNFKMYMGFMLDDLIASTSITANTWYHVAYVYDYSTKTQLVYLQGVLDGTKTSAGPYQGLNGSIVIGSSHLSSSSFNGFIDNLLVTTRAKTATEILADASVVVYFSFDGTSLTDDSGPNKMNGTLSNGALISGRVGQALSFSGSGSYLQIYGFYQLGRSNQAYSFVMWLYPYSVTGGALIHKTVFQYSNATWCQTMLGFTYAGQIASRVNGANPQITGPFISTLQWTHVGFTYSSTSGGTMYINGVRYANTGATSFSSSNNVDWLTIGYNIYGCNYSPVVGGYYFGLIDEFYVYRRELSASDVYSLANP